MTDNTNNQNKEGMSISSILAGIILGLIACALITLCSSCTTTKYVPVIEHTTDTLVQSVVERDSIYVHDSIRVTEKGDTMKIERWHTQYRDRWHHDSVYVAKHDTIPQPYPVTEYVERSRTTFEWLLIIVGIAALFGGIIWLANKVKKYLII